MFGAILANHYMHLAEKTTNRWAILHRSQGGSTLGYNTLTHVLVAHELAPDWKGLTSFVVDLKSAYNRALFRKNCGNSCFLWGKCEGDPTVDLLLW
jgi:hypothetical protein